MLALKMRCRRAGMDAGQGTVGLLNPLVQLQGIGVNVLPGVATVFQKQAEKDEEERKKLRKAK